MTSNVHRLDVYQDDAGGWRWRALARNGETVAQGESHTRVEDADRAARGVFGDDVPVTVTKAPPSPDPGDVAAVTAEPAERADF